MAFVVATCGIAIIAYLWLCDPACTPAPQCIFHRLTGFDCPGCGSQRAVHALLHGKIADAWGFNPAIFFALPVIALYLVNPKPLRRVLHSEATLWAIAIAVILWWILRNLL